MPLKPKSRGEYVNVKVLTEVWRAIKIRAAELDITQGEYIAQAVKEKLEKEKGVKP